MSRTVKDYAWAIFNNVYNYTLLAGVGAAGLLTHEYWLLIVGAGAEVLWMLHAPSLGFVRRAVDKRFAAQDAAQREAERQARLMSLTYEDRQRCRLILAKQREIGRLAAQNQSFGAELLAAELEKLDTLVGDFIELAATSARYRTHLAKANIGEVEKLARQYEREADTNDEDKRNLAKKNLDVVLRRLERLREIDKFLARAGGQLELIENSFGLLADQIVSMREPSELGGQLDDLMDGVNAVRETARETEALLEGDDLSRERALKGLKQTS